MGTKTSLEKRGRSGRTGRARASKLFEVRSYDTDLDPVVLDVRRAHEILERIGDETAAVIDRLNAGLATGASFRMVEAGIAESQIHRVFGEVRFEAYADAADLARAFAKHCEEAALGPGEPHLAATLRAVAQMFRTYAERLDVKAKSSLDAARPR